MSRRALAQLVLLPGAAELRFAGVVGVREHVRMAPYHLLAYRAHHVAELELLHLFGHLRVERNLKEQIAELVTQLFEIATGDGVGHFVGLLDGVRRNAGKGLPTVPGTAVLRVTQLLHYREQIFDASSAAHERLRMCFFINRCGGNST